MTMHALPAIRCVGALVVDPDGRLLLVLRANEPGRGKWSVPGGRVEPDEDDEAAVRREADEETGLTVTVDRLVGMVERPAPQGIYEIYDYLCTTSGGTPNAATDAADARWVSPAEFSELHYAGQLVDRLAETLWDWGVITRPS
ncbi:MAG TPA: NUDIX domain-containing protein [Pseudonocardiaceae bacterium]|jgi:ADP-ribose pyrophosphatase YjhB (NUDIX family)